MIAVVLKGIAGRKVRALLTAFAIVIGVSMVAGTFILTDTTQQSGYAVAATSTMTTDAVIFEKQIVKGSMSGSRATMPVSMLDKVRALPGVADAAGEASPQLEANVADIVGRDGRVVARQSMGRGLDPAKRNIAGSNGGVYGPLELASGTWAKGPGQVVIDRHYATTEHFKVGDRIVISTLGTRHTFTLAGTVKYMGEDLQKPPPSLAVWDITSAQKLFHREGRFDLLAIDAKPGTTGADLERAIKPLLPANLQVKSAKAAFDEAADDWDHTIASIRAFLLVFGLIALLVGAFVIVNTLSITVAQRTRELGTLRTLGASRRQIMRSVVIEGFVLGVVGSALGLVVGYGIAKGMLVLVDSMGIALPEGKTVVAPRTVLVSMTLGVFITLVASILPARRATRVPPIAAVREGAQLTSNRLVWLVRPLVRLVGAPARHAGGAAGQLASANSVRNPGRTAATAATLMIGLTLVTAVAVLGTSANHKTRSAVSDQVRADFVIDAKEGVPFAAASGDKLAAVPGVTAVSHVRADSALVGGKETEISGLDPATIGHFYRFKWTAGSLAGLDGTGALVTKRYAQSHHVTVGGVLAVTTPDGTKAKLVVRGIYDAPKSGALLGDVSVSRQAFDAAFKSPHNSLTLLDADARGAAALKPAAARLGDVNLHTGAAYPKDKTKDMATLLAMLYVLLGFSIVVSLLGMVNTMVLSVFERTREVGMLRTLGMTRRQTRRMIRHESVITALIGATLGLACGLVVGVAVTALTPDYTTLSLPWQTLAGFTLVAVAAGIAAAVLPARRASRLNVLAAISYE